jgi:HSP20 family molecular chaperone IbpA
MIPSPFHGIFSSSIRASEEAKKAAQSDALSKHSAVAQQGASAESRATQVGQVALDIFEFDNYYILKAPIAGVRLSDIDIEVTDNVVTIRGVRRQSDTVPDGQYYLRECFWGEFKRSVTLPCAVDPRKVKATFNKESILKIIVPKEEKIKIVRISE